MEKKIPIHVAIIPDGNRRWARKKGLNIWKGHERAASYANIKKLIQSARNIGVKYLSAWGFSTENWSRSLAEKKILFRIFEKLIDDASDDLVKEKIRFVHVGRKDRISTGLREKIKKLEEATKEFDEFWLVLFLDYGGRDEIVRAVNEAVRSGREVDEASFSGHLDTAGIPDPDLIVRTGGEKRLSGLMPFQSVYSELYFAEKYFPDFTSDDLRNAVIEFGKRKRNFGE